MANDSRTATEQLEKQSHDEKEGKDRKRLKERLKKAMTDETAIKTSNDAGWLEIIFGIRSANRRMGKVGSRSHRRLMLC